MTLMSPLVTGVYHHKGLWRHGGGAPPTGVVVRVTGWPGMWLHGGSRAAGLQGCRAAGWCMFYYRHNFVNFLDWPLIFRANPSRRFLGQIFSPR